MPSGVTSIDVLLVGGGGAGGNGGGEAGRGGGGGGGGGEVVEIKGLAVTAGARTQYLAGPGGRGGIHQEPGTLSRFFAPVAPFEAIEWQARGGINGLGTTSSTGGEAGAGGTGGSGGIGTVDATRYAGGAGGAGGNGSGNQETGSGLVGAAGSTGASLTSTLFSGFGQIAGGGGGGGGASGRDSSRVSGGSGGSGAGNGGEGEQYSTARTGDGAASLAFGGGGGGGGGGNPYGAGGNGGDGIVIIRTSVAATSYTVTYDANGGSVSPLQATFTAGGAPLALPTPERVGYVFNGWFTQASGGTRIGSAGEAYSPSADVTLHAQWIRAYTVTYDANGGSASPTQDTYIEGTSGIQAPLPRRAGFTFNGWFDQRTGGSLAFWWGVPFRVSQDTTFYAQWTALSYTVTYDANGGSVSPSSASYATGDAALTLPTPTRSGFTFDGWYDQAPGGTRVGSAGGSYTPYASVTLYAQWTAAQPSPGSGTSDGSSASSSTQSPQPTVDDRQILRDLDRTVPAGQAAVRIGDGSSTSLNAAINGSDAVSVAGTGWSIDVARSPASVTERPAGSPLVIAAGGGVRITAGGFSPGSTLLVALQPSGALLGSLKVDADGRVDGTLDVPSDSVIGDSTLQVAGILPGPQAAGVAIGLLVERMAVLAPRAVGKVVMIGSKTDSARLSNRGQRKVRTQLGKVDQAASNVDRVLITAYPTKVEAKQQNKASSRARARSTSSMISNSVWPDVPVTVTRVGSIAEHPRRAGKVMVTVLYRE